MKIIYFILLAALPFSVFSQHLEESPQAETTEVNFKVYPNPAYTDIVYIKTPRGGDKEITVYDVFGKTVLHEQLRTNTLDISKLVAGVYLLKVVFGDTTLTRKLIVK